MNCLQPARSKEELLALIKPMAREYQNGNPDLARQAQLLAQMSLLYDELFAQDPDGEP
jgi:hypothetical protein